MVAATENKRSVMKSEHRYRLRGTAKQNFLQNAEGIVYGGV